MTDAISTIVVMFLFVLITSVNFLFFTTTWVERSIDSAQAIDRQLERVNSALSIESTSVEDSACVDFTAQVQNTGQVLIDVTSEMDLLVDYTNASDTKVATRLSHGSTWSVASYSPDTRDPNAWNPNETATVNFTLPSALKGGTRGRVLMATPLGITDSIYIACICVTGNTGFSDPSAEAADTGGDGDGYELNPTVAFADGGGFASNLDGPGDRHRFHNYGLSMDASCNISGIEVRLDWWVDTGGEGTNMDVELSWNGGALWTAAKTDSSESTTERTVILGGSADTWGRSWTVAELSNANFRLRATINGNGGQTHYLDWIPVNVHYEQ